MHYSDKLALVEHLDLLQTAEADLRPFLEFSFRETASASARRAYADRMANRRASVMLGTDMR